MLTTTLSVIRLHSPCTDGWRTLLTALGKTEADDEPLAIEKILETNGIDDALWALRAVYGYQGAMRLFACYCARLALPNFEKKHPDDKRPRQAIETAERFAHGKATEEELEAARAAAWAAAGGAVAWNSGSATAWAAAWAAAGGAVAWNSGSATAWAAADAVAWGAAWEAARAVVRAATKANIQREFIRMCNLEGEYGEVGK